MSDYGDAFAVQMATNTNVFNYYTPPEEEDAESTSSSKIKLKYESVSPNKMDFTPTEESNQRNEKDTTPQQTPFPDSELICDRRCQKGTRRNNNDKPRSIEQTKVETNEKTDNDGNTTGPSLPKGYQSSGKKNNPISTSRHGIDRKHNLNPETGFASSAKTAKTDSGTDSFEKGDHCILQQSVFKKRPSKIAKICDERKSNIRIKDDTMAEIIYTIKEKSEKRKNPLQKAIRVTARIDIRDNSSATDAVFTALNNGIMDDLFRNIDCIVEREQEQEANVLQIKPTSENFVSELCKSIDNEEFDLALKHLLKHESVFKHIREERAVVSVDFTIPHGIYGIVSPNHMSFTPPKESDTQTQKVLTSLGSKLVCSQGENQGDDDRNDIPTSVEKTEVKTDEKTDTDETISGASLSEDRLHDCTDRNDLIQGDDKHKSETESESLLHSTYTDSESDSPEEQEGQCTLLRPIIMKGPSNTLNFYENGTITRTIKMEGDTNVQIIYTRQPTSDREIQRPNESGTIGARIDIEGNSLATDAALSVSNRDRIFEDIFKDNDSIIEKLEKGSIVLQIRPLSENSVRKLLNSIDNGDFDLTIKKLLSHESVFKHIRGKNVIVKVDLTIPEELLPINQDPQFTHIDTGSDVCVSVKENDNDDDMSTESELTSSHDSVPQEANTGQENESRKFMYKTFIGLRVVHRLNCDGGASGRDENLVGTVTTLENNCEVRVTWDDGTRSAYTAGKDGRYDLRVFDSGPIGIRHKGVTCCGCDTKDFFGTRWTCTQCKNTNLCFLCYSGDKHDLDHVFRRHDIQGDPGIEVNTRRTSQRIQSVGQFPGAKVKRGEDWKWGQQDGGEGKTGHIESEVESRENITSIRNVVRVKWDNGQSNMYRAGHDGRMDLKCIETAPGPCYYKEHMPLLDVSDVKKGASNDTNLVPGCKVCIHLEKRELEHIQNQKGEWSAELVECIGRTGVILSFLSEDVANVDFGCNQYNIAKIALSKVHEHSEQDVVRIMTNKRKVVMLQNGHGGWTDKMEMVLGKVGRVTRVDKDGDVVVVFGSIMWFFNAACCIPAPGERVDDLQMETSIPDLAGLLHHLQHLHNETLTKLMELIQVSAKPDSKDILTAVFTGDVQSVKSFLKANPNKVNERLGDVTPLVIACHAGQNKIVNILLEHGADMEVKVDHGATALAIAIMGGKEDIVKTLIDYGANTNVVVGNGQTVLHLAVFMKLGKTLKPFIDNGTDVNALDAFKDTPLHDAILSRSDECIEVLLECPDLNLRLYNSRNFNQLQFATLWNNVFAVEKIIEKDKSLVDLLMADGSFCALHIAAANDHVECARLLIEKGNATVDRKGKGGLTALHVAAATNSYNMIELLLDKGADVNHCDDLRDTPLHALFFVSTMKKYEQGIFGKTFSTVEEERITKTAFLLLEKQADITLKNVFGFTPLDLCLSEKVKRKVKTFMEENNGSFNSEGRADTFPKPSPFKFKTEEQNLLSNLNMSSPPFRHLTNTHLTTLSDLELISSNRAVKNVPMHERSILQ